MRRDESSWEREMSMMMMIIVDVKQHGFDFSWKNIDSNSNVILLAVAYSPGGVLRGLELELRIIKFNFYE